MKKTRVAINGFGRIGRVTAKYILDQPTLELVAINDLTDTATLAHLFKYDSIHGRFKGTVTAGEDALIINGVSVHCFAKKDPEQLKWKQLEVDVVIESTGHLTDGNEAMRHINAGAKKVIISAPAKSDDIKAVVLGVNEHILDRTEKIISNASCTTNCAAPMIKIIDELCGIESCYVSTIHSYTNDQRIHDAPHSDLRRARAAALSIIPTTTGAAKAITKIFPNLHGKVGGCGIRVPVPDGSLTDITFIVNRHDVTVEEINAKFKAAANGKLKGILGYTDEPVVGIDCVGQTESCVIDGGLTSVIGDMVKIVGWYDNESGYSMRLVDLVKYISK
jgi:glyceraldehyde 3-phosphate dehydrogenase